jgi:outer membrane protein OmpA-like peptidoglycan-associated protein
MLRAFALLAAVAAAMLAGPAANAQSSPTAAEIIERLKSGAPASPEAGASARRTRGLSIGPAPSGPSEGRGAARPTPSAADRTKIDSLFAKRTRGLSSGEREQAAAIAAIQPTIDLTIYFDYNSAAIGPKAVPALIELGRALSSSELAGQRFLVAGHTDARGGGEYNQRLSEQRAAAIRNFLVTQFRIDEARLLAIGFGKEQLKNQKDPFSGDNRRVQVVSFGN